MKAWSCKSTCALEIVGPSRTFGLPTHHVFTFLHFHYIRLAIPGLESPNIDDLGFVELLPTNHTLFLFFSVNGKALFDLVTRDGLCWSSLIDTPSNASTCPARLPGESFQSRVNDVWICRLSQLRLRLRLHSPSPAFSLSLRSDPPPFHSPLHPFSPAFPPFPKLSPLPSALWPLYHVTVRLPTS